MHEVPAKHIPRLLTLGFTLEELLPLEYNDGEYACRELVAAGLTRARLDEYRRTVVRPTLREASLPVEKRRTASTHYLPFGNDLLRHLVTLELFTMTCLSEFEEKHFYEYLFGEFEFHRHGGTILKMYMAHDAFSVSEWIRHARKKEIARQKAHAGLTGGRVSEMPECPRRECLEITMPQYITCDSDAIRPVVRWRDPPTPPGTQVVAHPNKCDLCSGKACRQCCEYAALAWSQREKEEEDSDEASSADDSDGTFESGDDDE